MCRNGNTHESGHSYIHVLRWIHAIKPGGYLVAETTHIFLKDPELVSRLEAQADLEHSTKTAVVTRALERYFAEIDAQEAAA